MHRGAIFSPLHVHVNEQAMQMHHLQTHFCSRGLGPASHGIVVLLSLYYIYNILFFLFYHLFRACLAAVVPSPPAPAMSPFPKKIEAITSLRACAGPAVSPAMSSSPPKKHEVITRMTACTKAGSPHLHSLDHDPVLLCRGGHLHPPGTTDAEVGDVPVASDLVGGVHDDHPFLAFVCQQPGNLPDGCRLANPCSSTASNKARLCFSWDRADNSASSSHQQLEL